MIKFIDSCLEKCLAGKVLKKSEIIKLLGIEIGTEEDKYLRKAARTAAEKITGNNGCIWCAVGMDYAPCPMNCKFCSFGENWGLIDESRHIKKAELLDRIKSYVDGGAAYVVLRTTEFYSLDALLDYVPEIRKAVPGDYAIILNTGELDMITAQRVADAGVYGVYHALRFREGQDTPFEPSQRIATMQSVTQTDLNLISLVEPLGNEHTDDEIADLFLNAVSCGAKMSGVMARFPVKGTPYGETERISDEKVAHVVAALRLSGGTGVRDICVHPATEEALNSGANVMVVEAGAIPRDADFSEKEWHGMSMENARELLKKCGYRVAPPPAKRSFGIKRCPCEGSNLEKFIQPIILHILHRHAGNGYYVYLSIGKYVTYGDASPDKAVTYRYLKNMEKRGLLEKNDGVYSITALGEECLDNWKRTLNDYSSTLKVLTKQLEK